jgi:2-dehydro-3-deoxyphosphogluconate aldolase / (4S)-4-hydroxy-2-oxoglutarate aldolase
MITTAALDELGRRRLLPVVVLPDESSALGLAAALVQGGLPVAEVTLRTPAALAGLRVMAQQEGLLVGAGTVVRPYQVEDVVQAGARFVVTPGFSAAVVRECQTLGVPVIPGIATATEVQMAIEAGLTVVKVFPAAVIGGTALIKGLAAPYPEMRFIPTGGINPANVGGFLALPEVLAVGGSWMVPAGAIGAGDFNEIRQLTAAAVSLAEAG